MKEQIPPSLHVILDIPKEGLCDLPCRFFEEISQETLSLSGLDVLQNKEIGINICEVDDVEMARLNKEIMGKEGSTDILSFPSYGGKEELSLVKGNSFCIGDIILCPSVIRQDALRDEVSYEREMTFVFSHGILHLLGYEHGEEMFALQDEVCETRERKK